MDITRLECPKCGAPLSEESSKLICKYCGHESILESKKANEIGEKVSSSITSSSESTQVELKRLQLTQELSALQMQLSNLRSEKRSLTLVKPQTGAIRQQLAEIANEEKDLQFRIQAIQRTLYPQPGNELRIPATAVPLVAVEINGVGYIQNQKSQGTALALAILLGYLGAHRFYTGHKGLGVLYLLTMGLGGIGWIIDILLIATNHYKDKQGYPLAPMGPTAKKLVGFFFLGCLFAGVLMSATGSPDAGMALGFLAAGLVIYGRTWRNWILGKVRKAQ